MKKTILFLLLIFTIGCSPDSDKKHATSTLTDKKPSTSFQLDCVIKEEWLNPDYDNNIDYSNPDTATDFFLLVYSNAPDFCYYKDSQGRLSDVPFQCSSGNKFGWVIHGLWSQSKTAYINGKNNKHPRFCQGNLAKLKLDTLKPYLCMTPGTRLLQGEWEKHGACDFNTAEQYFAKTQELYKRFKTAPADLNAKNAVRWMRDNNQPLKKKWLHQTKHEFGICFNTNFELISCPKKAFR